MENELSRVVDALPGLVWTALPDGQVDFVNQGWCEYTGSAAEQARGDGWQVAVHPNDLAAHRVEWQAVCISGLPGEMETRLRRFDGQYRRFLVRVRPLTDAEGRIVKWCGVNADIEDSRLVEEARARAKEVELRSLVDSLPAFVALASPTGEVEYFNTNAQQYIGSGLDAQSGWKAADLVHPDDREQVLHAWRTAIATGAPYDMEHRIRCVDGAYRWFDVRGRPLRDRHGAITRWCVVDVDINEHKHDKALLTGERKLLEMVARGQSRSEVLNALCELVAETLDGCLCSVLLVGSSGARLEYGAAPRLPSGFVSAIVGRTVHAEAGPSSMAVSLQQRVIAADLETETRWKADGWTDMAMSYGLQACWSSPIAAEEGDVLGALEVYYDQPRTPTARDLNLIDQLTHIASIAIARQRSQVALAQAVDEVRASEDRLRSIVDAMPGFVWSADPDGSVDFLNKQWCEYTGVAMEAALGNCWHLTTHPDDTDRLQAHWQSLLRSGEAGEAEARLRRHDGTYRWFLIRTVPLRDSTARIVKWYGQNTDIDDRKKNELLLSGENHLLGMMAGGAPLPPILGALCELIERTLDGSICSVMLVDPKPIRLSHDATPFVRLQPGAAPNLPAWLLVGTDGRPVDRESDPVAAAVTSAEPVIVPDLTKENRWVDWCALALSHGLKANWSFPILSTSGAMLGVLSVLHHANGSPSPIHLDLVAQFTQLASIAIERARGESALRQSEAFLAKAQQLSMTGTFSWRVATDEITWSEEVYRIFQLDPTITPTFDLIDLRLHPDDMQSHHETFERQRREGTDFESAYRLLMPDGSVKYVRLVAHANRDLNGDLEYIAAVQDVTERRLSEEALDSTRAELAHVARVATLGAVTASIAHEVNQPLAGIITNASTCMRMLGADPPNVEGARETARRTIRDGNRASDVIKRLRALFSKKEVTVERVDLNEAAREVIAMLLGEMHRNGITVHTELDDNLPQVMGDRVQLQQVILNLLANSADSMRGIAGRSRHVTIRTSSEAGEFVRLAVKDTGVGFDPQDEERIFSAFYTTKHDGMGIGLSISRSIIESHDGRMWATRNDGPGATFTFCIPRLPDGVTNTRATGVNQSDAGINSDSAVESF